MTEEWGGRHWRRTALLVAVLSLAIFLVLGFWPAPDERATEIRGRSSTGELREEMRRLVSLVESMESCTPVAIRDRKREIVDVLQGRIRPHLADQECAMYPVLDEHFGGAVPLTSSVRLENVVMRRWIDELAEKASLPYSDTVEFSRRVYALLGLIEARLEVEDKLLQPMYDRALSPEEIRAESGGLGGARRG